MNDGTLLFEKRPWHAFCHSLLNAVLENSDPNDRFWPVVRIAFLFQLYCSFIEDNLLFNRYF